MTTHPFRTRIRSAALTILVPALLASLAVTSGCRQAPVEVVRVEVAESTTGRNTGPLKREMTEAAETGVALWVEGDPEKLETVFTENMMDTWRQLRDMDDEEGVERVRVHSEAEYFHTALDEDEPRLRYEFLDESYFIDAQTRLPVTEPYNTEREIVIRLVREDGTLKIDSMIGSTDGLR